ncbi:MAG: sulfite exporter TauE/SafE family protein [Bacteroidota bacterium]
MSWEIVLLLVCSGILVGFINTLAGSGTIISISVFVFLGLPVTVANGTHRVAVIFQNLVAVHAFKKQKVLDTRKGLWLAIPVVIGSVLGAFIAVKINEDAMEKVVGIVMLIMLFFIFYKPGRWLKEDRERTAKPVQWWEYGLYFLMGVYGGFIHIGVGIFMLVTLVLNSGYDLVKANAIKNLLVLLYVPFALFIFIISGMVNFSYGLVHAVGNMIGAWLATRYAVKWGADFVRWVLVVVIIGAVGKFLGIYEYFGLMI